MIATSALPDCLRSPPRRAALDDAPDGHAAEPPGVVDAQFDALFDDPSDRQVLPAECALPAGRKLCADEAQLSAWLTQIADRDERALSALYDATLARVYGLVLRVVRRPALAEEAVEDTYFQVWRQAVRFDACRGRALSWLLSLARSRAIDTLRRETRFNHDTLEDDDAPGLVDAGLHALDDLMVLNQRQVTLQRALLALGAQPRQLVALAFLRGLSHSEIAAQTKLPVGTVKSQIRRALILLRDLLNDSGAPAMSA